MKLSVGSAMVVSPLRQEIDAKVKACLERPIEGDRLYLWIDASYL